MSGFVVLSLMGTRAERNKEDFVGGFGFGVVEHSHKDVMLPSHHYHPYSSPSSASFCYCSNGAADPIFSASNTSSLGEMFSLEGSNASAAVSVADPFFTLTSSGLKFSPFITFSTRLKMFLS